MTARCANWKKKAAFSHFPHALRRASISPASIPATAECAFKKAAGYVIEDAIHALTSGELFRR
jgi:hypothetical protein